MQTNRLARGAALAGLLITLSTGLVACGKSDSGLTGETWAVSRATAVADQFTITRWVSIGASARYTVRFDANGTLSGMADCNQISGTYTMSGQDKISVTLGGMTLMACPDDPAGSLFAAALGKASNYAIPSSGHLTLTMGSAGSIDFVPVSSLPTMPPSTSPAASASGVASAVPSDASASPSASPTASPSVKPTAAPTAKPTAAPTATPAPTSAATATPAPSPIALNASCTSPAGVVVAYPETWFTVGADVPEFACAVFDRIAIALDPSTGMPANGPVRVADLPTVPYKEAVTAATAPNLWTQVVTASAKVSGLPATVVTAVATGGGSLPAGTTAYSYIVDRGTLGSLVLNTTAVAADPKAAENRAVVDAMAGKVLFKAPR